MILMLSLQHIDQNKKSIYKSNKSKCTNEISLANSDCDYNL